MVKDTEDKNAQATCAARACGNHTTDMESPNNQNICRRNPGTQCCAVRDIATFGKTWRTSSSSTMQMSPISTYGGLPRSVPLLLRRLPRGRTMSLLAKERTSDIISVTVLCETRAEPSVKEGRWATAVSASSVGGGGALDRCDVARQVGALLRTGGPDLAPNSVEPAGEPPLPSAVSTDDRSGGGDGRGDVGRKRRGWGKGGVDGGDGTGGGGNRALGGCLLEWLASGAQAASTRRARSGAQGLPFEHRRPCNTPLRLGYMA